MSSEQKPVTWRGRDLSTDDTIMFYHGRLQIDSIHGSAYLQDLPDAPLLEEVLWSDNYEVEIRVIRRIPAER